VTSLSLFPLGLARRANRPGFSKYLIVAHGVFALNLSSGYAFEALADRGV